MTNQPTRILVWDLPTRLFHWSLAASFTGAFLTADSEKYRDIHVALGYTLFGLILFRVLWGLVGSRYARFSSLPLRPSAVVSYLRSLFAGKPEHHIGHNPAGSYAVLALLALAATSAVSGYLAYNELGSDDLHEFVANAMLAVVGIHVAAVIVSSRLHQENLVAAMITGFKQGRAEDGIQGGRWAVATALVAAVVAGVTSLAQASPPKDTATADESSASHHEGRGSSSKHERDDD